MHLLKPSGSFTRYALPHPVQGDVSAHIQRHRFRPIDATSDERAFGFVPLEDMLDHDWMQHHPACGAYHVYSLRLDTRRVSPAVLRKERTLAEKEARQEAIKEGRNFLSRDRKKELAEQVKLRLLAKAPPVPAVFDVVQGEGLVWLNSVNGKVSALFQDIFANAMDCPLIPLDAVGLADRLAMPITEEMRVDERRLGREFLTWLLWLAQGNLEVGGYTVTTMDRVSLAGDGVSVLTLPQDHGMDEVRAAMAAGKLVEAVKVQLEGEGVYSVLLKSDMTLNALKTPKVEVDKEDEEAGMEAAILEKIFLLEQSASCIDVMYAHFLHERMDATAWTACLAGMNEWITDDIELQVRVIG